MAQVDEGTRNDGKLVMKLFFEFLLRQSVGETEWPSDSRYSFQPDNMALEPCWEMVHTGITESRQLMVVEP
jgi:hypothetical protein